MNQTEVKALVISLLDITGLKKILTSVSATLISFGVNDIAQLIAISVGIVSGVMAIRHYAVATKLNQAKLDKLNSQQDGAV
ncbi:hypothetical protein OPW39_25675 [Vibrio europaeus]|uniref:hypothetical protein n=1 Tax=Vibrio europaeus TaxID=300876 RepID=UPI00233F2CB3|nr:hypothetical protein [Vibrio europaeus]MDC5872196.1 hypothetical protein [Vibrio europaeus]